MNERDLEGKLNDDVLKSIHNHKHNYADDFGYVMRSSLIRIRNRLLQSATTHTDADNVKEPDTDGIRFSDADIKTFWRAYDLGVKAETLYGMLGKDFFGKSDSEQLIHIKQTLVRAIINNEEYLRTLIDQKEPKVDKSLKEKLQRALDMSFLLRERIEDIENTNISMPTSIPLVNVIKEAFKHFNDNRNAGVWPIMDEYFYPDDLREVTVFADRDLFRENILDNIIRNLNQHAFAGFDKEPSLITSITQKRTKRSWWKKGSEHSDSEDVMDLGNVQEKLVAVRFSRIDNDCVEVKIENNGQPFTGDCGKVFERGVGEGSGIGLDCAKRYIEEQCSGSISMYTSEGKYKVGFKIILPIYGKI